MNFIAQHRAAIGRWHLFTLGRPLKKKRNLRFKLGESMFNAGCKLRPSLLLTLYICSQLLLLCGDVKTNPGPTKSLTINHINAHSLCPSDRTKKLDEIHSLLCVEEQIDIICVSETWLKSQHTDLHVSLPDYQLFRSDRAPPKIGGGAAIYIHESIDPIWRTRI